MSGNCRDTMAASGTSGDTARYSKSSSPLEKANISIRSPRASKNRLILENRYRDSSGWEVQITIFIFSRLRHTNSKKDAGGILLL